MKKFNPVQYNRDKWSDTRHTKNNPKNCKKDHKFCHFQYQWASSQANNGPIVEEHQNYILPEPQDKRNNLNYEAMTVQNLDDWYAQSINRSIGSMINPQKKFYLPPQIQEDLKERYRKKILAKQFQDETYFKKQKKIKRTQSFINNDKKAKTIQDFFIDHRNLQTKTLAGVSLKSKQKIQIKPKIQIKRRNAVLLDKDIHYSRFLKQAARTKQKQKRNNAQQQQKQFNKVVSKNQMIYSFNIQSMKRTSCYDDVPNSIIEREFQRITKPKNKGMVEFNRHHFSKEDEIQEQTREKMNQKTNQALTRIEHLTKKQSVEKIVKFVVKNMIQKNESTSKASKDFQQIIDKKIGQKVKILLNNMQVVSQHIDVEMSKLNIHLSEVFLKHPTQKIQNKWVIKAQNKIRQKQSVLAIDCYKQALIIQPQFFIPIFNIAVLLQKEQMLSYARDWFKLAKQFETDIESVCYGLAVVQVKQLNFQEGLKEIDTLINKLESNKKKVQIAYYYLRALCYKQLEKNDMAKQDYEIIIKNSKPANQKSLTYFLLSVVFAKSRRYSPKFNCLSFMNWKQNLFLLFYERQKKVREDHLSSVQMAQKLIKKPFFCRFSINLIKKLLDQSKYESIKKDTLIFLPPSQSMILLNGLIEVRSHENIIEKPKIVSVLKQGSIVGADEIDSHMSSRPNCWLISKTDLEILKISRAEFKLFWQGQITFQMDYKFNFLKNVGLFKGLCQSTLFKLCEIVQRRTYEKNTILFNDCSYRNQLISKQGLGFCLGKTVIVDPRFVSKRTKIDESPKRKKVKSRLFQICKKNIFKLNEMKFNRLKYPGLFILMDGKVEVQDDRGFRCKGLISQRDYFGQNLVIQSDGFHNYGRMVVQSQSASFFLLNTDKMVWTFTSFDKDQMQANVKNRKEIETIRFLKNRFYQCLEVKLNRNKDQ